MEDFVAPGIIVPYALPRRFEGELEPALAASKSLLRRLALIDVDELQDAGRHGIGVIAFQRRADDHGPERGRVRSSSRASRGRFR